MTLPASGAELGYLLPTRERILAGRPEGEPLLALAETAEGLGFDSVWVGDSLLARPRHEPLTLLGAVAGRTRRVRLGTAVLLPALRNPVVLAHQVATLDQVSGGRVVLGVGIGADTPGVRGEFEAAGVPFEGRVGRMLEGLRLARALWSGEPVDWEGRWRVRQGVLAPVPRQPGGPPIWLGSFVEAGERRAARHFDGWFPTGPDAATWGERWQRVQALAREAGRDPEELTPAVYLTLALDPDPVRAESSIDRYLEAYYGAPAPVLRRRQAAFGGPVEAAGEWIRGYVDAGARHVVLRLVGEQRPQLEALARHLRAGPDGRG